MTTRDQHNGKPNITLTAAYGTMLVLAYAFCVLAIAGAFR